MARTVGIGIQDFGKVIENNCFYIDKTSFIKEWWESKDEVTLITRPRRFGKTLNMSMMEYFFSTKYKGGGSLFEGLSIWEEKFPGGEYRYRALQGTYPVISISFANVKERDYATVRKKICQIFTDLYIDHSFLLDSDALREGDKEFFRRVSVDMDDVTATLAIHNLAKYMNIHYGKRVIILLDEYDTPMQEAYVNGYWGELVAFTRSLFNATFKTNPYLERAIMTGITRISKESIFSDLNNLEVITTTSGKYSDCFGFTEEEVFKALDEFGLSDDKQQVKDWYDGFTFGEKKDIYNPWSIINYLDKGKVGAYWANSSSNSLVGKLVREGSPDTKQTFELLLRGETLNMEIDEQIIYNQLGTKKNAVWSLLLASGYLKVIRAEFVERVGRTYYDLALTNKEVRVMFEVMIQDWFSGNDNYNCFVKALLLGDLKAMNTYMNKVSEEMFSSFDVGKKASGKEPERFYHGFVLGLMVELADKYVVTSNRESGFGRYDIMLEPRMISPNGRTMGSALSYDGIIIEFKVQDDDEKDMSDTVGEALKQIEEKDYQANLVAKGIPEEKIRKYGFAFCGKKVLIGTNKAI